MKLCTRCKELKPRTEFYPDHRSGRDLLSNCKQCGVKKQRIWRRDHGPDARHRQSTIYAERRWDRHLKRKYGIDRQEFQRILTQQGGKCAICKAEHCGGRANRFHVDHNHITDKLRGLLCTRCNQMLGYAQDNPEILRNAAEYLEADGIVAQVAAAFIDGYMETRHEM